MTHAQASIHNLKASIENGKLVRLHYTGDGRNEEVWVSFVDNRVTAWLNDGTPITLSGAKPA